MTPICVIPYCSKDREAAVKLASWIAELGGVSNHDCLLVHDQTTTPDGVIEPLRAAFKEVATLSLKKIPQADWHAGTGDARACNEMWIQTAWHVHYKLKRPWLWLEPDAIPLRASWLDDIAAEYAKAKRHFMGAKVFPASGGVRMSGIAVYPASVCDYGSKALTTDRIPWDVAGAEDFVKHAHFTTLIHHVLRSSKDAPTFPDANSLKAIQPGAVVFHPNKDDSLRQRLWEQLCNGANNAGASAPEQPPVSGQVGDRVIGPALTPPRSPSVPEQIREGIETIVRLIDGKPGRKALFLTVGRELGLLTAAKKRRGRKK